MGMTRLTALTISANYPENISIKTTENDDSKWAGFCYLMRDGNIHSLGINSEILNKLTNAELVFNQKRDGYLIYFILHAGNQVERIPYNIIAEQPIAI